MKQKQELIHLLVKKQVIQFGDFTLKSGIKSCYFFNFGKVVGETKIIGFIAEYLVDFILRNNLEVNLIFGPAYKGIPLALATCLGLYEHGVEVNFCYDRKEAKDHGEGGLFIGNRSKDGRILVLDDVLTMGTSIRSSIKKISTSNEFVDSKIIGCLVVLDRKEKNSVLKSELQQLKIPVFSILEISDIITYLLDNKHFVTEKQLEMLMSINESS